MKILLNYSLSRGNIFLEPVIDSATPSKTEITAKEVELSSTVKSLVFLLRVLVSEI